MIIESTSLDGVKIISPKVFKDDRGYFFESYKTSVFEENGLYLNFVQDNEVKSTKGVLRGLHYQLNNPQGKLVRAVVGEIIDVGNGIKTSVREVVELACKATNITTKIEWSKEDPSILAEGYDKNAANLPNERILNWRPKISLEKGLIQTFYWRLLLISVPLSKSILTSLRLKLSIKLGTLGLIFKIRKVFLKNMPILTLFYLGVFL